MSVSAQKITIPQQVYYLIRDGLEFYIADDRQGESEVTGRFTLEEMGTADALAESLADKLMSDVVPDRHPEIDIESFIEEQSK